MPPARNLKLFGAQGAVGVAKQREQLRVAEEPGGEVVKSVTLTHAVLADDVELLGRRREAAPQETALVPSGAVRVAVGVW